MEIVDILGKQYHIFAKVKGANDNKYNRAARLAHKFNQLEQEFTAYIKMDLSTTGILTQTNSQRLTLACLMLMHTGIRVGNEDSAEGYITKPHPNQKDRQPEFVQTYGLTTLKPEHFVDTGKGIDIYFLGKKCVDNSFRITHPVIISSLRALLASCGADNYVLGITAVDLTKFIKTYVGEQFSPKDFRTMRANLEAWSFLQSVNPMFLNKANKASQVRLLFQYVSSMLNNTPGVCKKSYICPDLIPYLNLIFQ